MASRASSDTMVRTASATTSLTGASFIAYLAPPVANTRTYPNSGTNSITIPAPLLGLMLTAERDRRGKDMGDCNIDYCECADCADGISTRSNAEAYWDICNRCRRPIENSLHHHNHYDGKDHPDDPYL